MKAILLIVAMTVFSTAASAATTATTANANNTFGESSKDDQTAGQSIDAFKCDHCAPNATDRARTLSTNPAGYADQVLDTTRPFSGTSSTAQ